MGRDAFIRNMFRNVCQRAYYPRPGPEWPKRNIRSYVSDINSLIRKKALVVSNNGAKMDFGFKTWGDLTRWLCREYIKIFAEGVTRLRVTFDGKTPENKSVEQHERRDAWERSIENTNDRRPEGAPEAAPYEWPKEDDGKPWFVADQAVFCSYNDIYYGGALSKRKFYEFVSGYLLYEMPLPPNCQVLVDSGALPQCGMMLRPMQARMEHLLAAEATVGDLRDAATKGITDKVKRVVEEVPGEDRYRTYTEADDRMM